MYSKDGKLTLDAGSTLFEELTATVEPSGDNYELHNSIWGFDFTFVMTNNGLENIIVSNVPPFMSSFNGIYALPAAHDHSFSSEWTTDEDAHWHECTAEDCEIDDYSTCGITDVAYGAHADSNGDFKCDTCGYFMKPDHTQIIADGQSLIIIAGRDVASVKDVFVALGEYSDYRSVKNNLVFGVQESTFAENEDYIRTVSALSGTYTALIRYKDGTSAYSTVTVEAANEPCYTFDGNTAMFNYGDNIKYVRFAEGTYISSQQIKNAPDCVTYAASSRRVIDGIFEREFSGTYTFVIAYLDGTGQIVTHTFG